MSFTFPYFFESVFQDDREKNEKIFSMMQRSNQNR